MLISLESIYGGYVTETLKADELLEAPLLWQLKNHFFPAIFMNAVVSANDNLRDGFRKHDSGETPRERLLLNVGMSKNTRSENFAVR